ncbi:MAG: polysaccharide deacetylase family protein, partial [Candidatus Azambacteria bacterium]|nr:polysaccharide deacetylase family protein [Candidatus Azambacteria bacterium]
VPFFRFPYGAPTKETITLVNGKGYVAVRWTVDSLGWQGRKDGRDANFVVTRVISKAVPGAIVLMHLGSATDGSTFDADALQEVITTLKQQGYRFVSLSELFSASL